MLKVMATNYSDSVVQQKNGKNVCQLQMQLCTLYKCTGMVEKNLGLQKVPSN